MEILINGNFTYYFLKVIVIYFLSILLIGLIWHFSVKYRRVKMGRGMFKNIILKY